MNPKAKGRKAELECQRILEKEGWKVYLVPPPRRMVKSADIFHLFDVIAVKGRLWRLIQVKSNRKPSFRPYWEFGLDHGFEGLSIEVWVRHDRKGWVKNIVWKWRTRWK